VNVFQLTTLLNNDHVFIDAVRLYRSIEYRLDDSPRFIMRDIIEEVKQIDGFEEWEEGMAICMAYFIFWELLSPKYQSLIESHKNARKNPLL
jgi:hypothetical protein